MKTRLTEMVGIKVPILLSGMSWISTPKMVAAVSNAGGLGILATGPLNSSQTREAIREIRKLTDKPFGANASLMFPGAAENAKVLLKEQVPVINFALGKGDWIVREAHKYGGKVFATVVNLKHAKRAQDFGTDAVIATGQEAAAHGEDVTSLVLIPHLAENLQIPVIGAGGFADGRGLAAALALGADGISMGSRFMVVRESLVHDNFKKLCMEATEQDTLYDNVFDGMDGRVLKTKEAQAMMKRGFPVVEAFKGALLIKKLMNLSFAKFAAVSIEMLRAEEGHPLMVLARQAVGNMKHLKALNDGDVEGGILFAGQCCGGITDNPTTKELIDRVIREAEEALAKLNACRK